MKKPKQSTGYLRIGLGMALRTMLITNRPIDEELFAAIKYYSEVKEVGTKFVKKFGHKNYKEVWLLFRAFVRQAETFYESANQLSYRAAALMYYYSFLNLAKGLICLTDPVSVSQPIGHGIHHKFEKSNFPSQFVTSDKNGVFPKFFETITKHKLPPRTKLNITKILGYCSDVAHEYSTGNFGRRRVTSANIRLLADSSTKDSWILMAAMYPEALSPLKKLKQFTSFFEQVDLDKDYAKLIFDINVEAHKHYEFFESKKIYPWIDDKIQIPNIVNDTRSVLEGYFESNPYEDDHVVLLSSPLTVKSPIPMNQTVAVYTAMYYLGSLVRYKPDYLESLLDSKDAWIIERFTKSAPLTFLRSITNYILGTEYIFASR